ncbi:MAG TPA: pyridoxal phosphate-dependent aminotransferase [Gemmataceae bacterium]|nr:pyridoxal phosphate-dependent aminotransferase [Gemmataceae bacterium]
MVESLFWRKVLARSGIGGLLPSVRRALLGGEAHLSRFSDRLLAAPLADLVDAALLPAAGTPDAIDLAMGTPRCGLGPAIRGLPVHRPPSAWGDPELRGELADRLRTDQGLSCDPADEVLITHGGTGAFATVLDAFVNPGDRAVLFDPTAPIFPIGLKHRRASVAWVPTRSEDGILRFDMTAFGKAIRGAKLLVLVDPANPTGGAFAAEDLEQIAFWARKADALIYHDVSFDPWRARPAAARLASLPHAEGRMLVAGSYAKSHGLTAARVGWLAGDRHLVRPCAVAAALAAPFVPPVCQHLALHAERGGTEAQTEMRTEFGRRRHYVRERLETMGLKPWASAAGFFYWVPVPGTETGREFAGRLYRETGVLVNPGHPFGPSGDRFVRISFATDEGRVGEGLNRLAAFVARPFEMTEDGVSDRMSADAVT